ncbi:MAG: hypothetical protein K9M80_08010 [Candidatus Marinimicrobia bacterium]|nr:hypothetical protein [Candidatus Neomarinimicrobiota bacterium]
MNKLKKEGIKPGLSRTIATLAKLGDPQKDYHKIHIAGTNGKASVSTIIASILQKSGYKTGLYTSPELTEFNDRIKINGQKIENSFIEKFIINYKSVLTRNKVSFFEAVTCLAFSYFQEQNVDYAVLETGMGGRFDATNVVSPAAFAITNISKDHQKYLGDTLAEITKEKAGIIKKNSQGATGRQREDVLAFLRQFAVAKEAKLFYAPEYIKIDSSKRDLHQQVLNINYDNIELTHVKYPLLGDFQIDNLQIALQVISLLGNINNIEAIRKGIENVHLRGRLELVHKNPITYYDVGHNPKALKKILKNLAIMYPDFDLNVIIALKKDKEYKEIGRILNKYTKNVYLFPIPQSKYYDSHQLYENWKRMYPQLEINKIDKLDNLKTHYSRKERALWLITGTHGLAKYVYIAF